MRLHKLASTCCSPHRVLTLHILVQTNLCTYCRGDWAALVVTKAGAALAYAAPDIDAAQAVVDTGFARLTGGITNGY